MKVSKRHNKDGTIREIGYFTDSGREFAHWYAALPKEECILFNSRFLTGSTKKPVVERFPEDYKDECQEVLALHPNAEISEYLDI